MAGRIPQSFIDELLARVDIVELVDARLPLKRSGQDFAACCPFHNEKTPSFTVSRRKQFYHCFGCGAHGTAVGFLMDYEHLDFVEAIEALAAEQGMDVPREAGEVRAHSSASQPLYDILQRAARFYAEQLRRHADAGQAVDYLKQRGLSGEVAARFGLGFAPPGWDALSAELGSDAAALKQLEAAGLVSRREGGWYDRFRARIMFPIRDRRGRVVAFGGRLLPSADQGPKYLNSPETPVFHKRRELYGLYEARKAVRKLERLVVVEGYMDVVALAQHGIGYAVATLGTATTREHLQVLYRTVPELVFCFDGDRAGLEAAWRAMETALPEMGGARQARFQFLPQGEDPDTLVRKEGASGFEGRLGKAVPLAEYLVSKLLQRADVATVDGRSQLLALAQPLLNKIEDDVFRTLLLDRLAELTGLRDGRLNQLLTQPERHDPSASRAPQALSLRSPVRLALALLLDRPALAAEVPQDEQEHLARYQLPGIPLLCEVLEICRATPNLSTAGLLERWRDRPEGEHLARLTQAELAGGETERRQELLDSLISLRRMARQKRFEDLRRKSAAGTLTEQETMEFNQLLRSSNP